MFRGFQAGRAAAGKYLQRNEGVPADISAVLSALKECSGSKDLQAGRRIHRDVIQRELESNKFVANTVMDMYAKCGSMVDARGVFERMRHPTLVSWNTMIMGYAQKGEAEMALQLFSGMQDKGVVPGARTYLAALKACSSVAEKRADAKLRAAYLKKGVEIHLQLSRTVHESDIFVASVLVDMYAKFGKMADARRVFDRIERLNLVAWNAIIAGYAHSEQAETALQLLELMRKEGLLPDARTYVAALSACAGLATKEKGLQIDGRLVKLLSLERGMAVHSQLRSMGHELNIFVANSLVDMYAKCGTMVDSRLVFEAMAVRDAVSWTSVISGYAQCGNGDIALQLFSRMQAEGVMPDGKTLTAVLQACSSLLDLETGRQIHAKFCRDLVENDVVMGACLVDFYSKCGSMDEAQQVFESLRSRDSVTWNTLMAGYSRQGDVEQVFDIFEAMRKQELLDGITFHLVLSACAHGGLVGKGKEYFRSMQDHRIVPDAEHYNCMVDLLARANHMEEALALIDGMPFKADATLWRTMLAACRKWQNLAVGRLAFDALLRLEPGDSAAYVLMANIYASLGMWDESETLQQRREQ